MTLRSEREFGFRQCVIADVWRCSGRQFSLALLIRVWFQDPAVRPVLTLRLVRFFATRTGWWWGMPHVLAKLWHRRTQARCGVDLPTSLNIGAGFKILHGWGVVINREARIGANVTVMQGVTIGGTGGGIPVIEDDVIVCANATVVGGVILGQGSVIGAGCVVTKNVAQQTTVVGNPQREIPRRQAPRGYNPAPLHGSD